MREIKRIPVKQIERDPEQPRKQFDEGSLLELGRNMQVRGQLVPLIVYWCLLLKRHVLLDGERRWRSMQLVGIADADAIVLVEKPTPAELRLMQFSLDAHRVDLSPMERSDALAAIRKEKGLGVGELAELVNLPQSAVSKLLAFQNGCPEVKDQLRSKLIDGEKAYEICREPDHDKQRELITAAPTSSREEIRQQVNGKGKAQEAKLSSARFLMPGGYAVSLTGGQLDLTTAVEVLSEAVRILKKGLAQGISLASQMKVLRDTSRAKPKV